MTFFGGVFLSLLGVARGLSGGTIQSNPCCLPFWPNKGCLSAMSAKAHAGIAAIGGTAFFSVLPLSTFNPPFTFASALRSPAVARSAGSLPWMSAMRVGACGWQGNEPSTIIRGLFFRRYSCVKLGAGVGLPILPRVDTAPAARRYSRVQTRAHNCWAHSR